MVQTRKVSRWVVDIKIKYENATTICTPLGTPFLLSGGHAEKAKRATNIYTLDKRHFSSPC